MSENKRYYWLKLKKDFFEQKMIKILRTFENGDRMITIFLKMELHSLENDGYMYYENMLPTFEQELAIAIDEETELVKTTLVTLLRFGAIRKEDENKYYITALEDCIGSETKDAARKRKAKEKSGNFPQKGGKFPPEIEKETDKELYSEKRRTPSSFSGEKKEEGIEQKTPFLIIKRTASKSIQMWRQLSTLRSLCMYLIRSAGKRINYNLSNKLIDIT